MIMQKYAPKLSIAFKIAILIFQFGGNLDFLKKVI